jgi:hypothetical protein
MPTTGELIVFGGVQYEGNVPSKRMSINDVVILSTTNNFSVSTLQMTGSPAYTSFHSSCLLDNNIVVHGGYSQHDTNITCPGDVVPCNTLHTINIDSRTCTTTTENTAFPISTAGHTAVVIDKSCILFFGGTEESIFVYTTKLLKPTACDHVDCHIEDSPEISPINWIQCDGECKMWLHQFCAAIKRVPRGKWICGSCKSKKK